MPKPVRLPTPGPEGPKKGVRCASCNRLQPDRGRHATCPYCGTSPLPSRNYPRDSGFYPQPDRPSLLQALREYKKRRTQ